MKIILDDITCSDDLYPFAVTRSPADIPIGILTIRQKWEKILHQKINTISELGGKELNDAKVISANILPNKKTIKGLNNNLGIAKDAVIIKYPWHIIKNNDSALREDFKLLTIKRKSKKISYTNTIIGDDIFLEEGVIVEHCILNASTGPIYLAKNAEIMEGSIIRGPFAMGEGSKLKMGTKIYGATTLGNYCIAGGEIKNSILLNYSNKAHDGYLGDSIIGEWCNLGAGTSTSNIKNTAGEVNVWNFKQQKYISAGLKCGLLMGDYSRAAINTSFNTGTVVGVACNIFCNDFPPKYVPDFSWGTENYTLEKAVEHINNWKQLKGKSITEKEKKILSEIYHQKNTNA